MKIAIVGSRTFNDYTKLKNFIDTTLEQLEMTEEVDCVVSGGAKGADSLAEKYAEEYDLRTLIFPADWKKYGKSAGFRRNVDIIKNCDICFAFWDGQSHGTRHDIDLCAEYSKPCYICKF